MGNARSALVAWLSVRSRGGTFVWRLEDLDPPRILPGAAAAAEEDLLWLGLDWDEGPGLGGPFGPYVQSQRDAFHEAALDRLEAAGRLFPCRLSRKDLESRVSSAPHGPESSPYPAELRPRELAPGWLSELRRAGARADAAIRFRVDPGEVLVHDGLFGELRERVELAVGDFVLRRRDGLWAYQLAVVVDDLLMEIDEVVRGRDLLDSAARQLQLIDALGGRRPSHLHLPLVLNAAGDKLSKRDGGLTLRALREAGVRPEALVGYLGWSLGLLAAPRAMNARELVPLYAVAALRRENFLLPDELAPVLRELELSRPGGDLRCGGWQRPT